MNLNSPVEYLADEKGHVKKSGFSAWNWLNPMLQEGGSPSR